MRTIETTGTIAADGTLTIQVPTNMAPGSHRTVIVVDEQPVETDEDDDVGIPIHDLGPWPEGLSLRREDMYDDWGR